MDNKRVNAGFIDLIIAALIQAILMFTFIMRPLMTGEMESENIIFINFRITAISMIYMLIRDILGEKSIGKRIVKLNIVDVGTNNKVSFLKRFIRNITWILGPVEIIVFLISGFRIGDKIAKTKIVLDS
ncbi:MAG: RDD family protein [Deltaproteobacteria bacterium]|nr:RDD family protein [Deltaproteobacteria bacterium]